MNVIRPILVTDAMLSSSNIAETDYAAWAIGTTYALGARVIRTTATTHRIYESVQASNVGQTPETSPSWWLDVGPTNRWAMFDQSVGSLSTRTGSIVVTFSPGAIDKLALLDVQGVSATVSMTVAGSTVYSRPLATASGGEIIDDWYDYFFEPVGTRTALIFSDLPVYPTGIVTVTIDAGGGSAIAACGTVCVGRGLNLGSTEAGADVGIIDYSRKQTDDFGITTLLVRGFSKRANVRTMIGTPFVDALQREMAKLRAVPTVWYEDGYDSLTLFGPYKDFSIDLALANYSYCSLTLEGLSTSN